MPGGERQQVEQQEAQPEQPAVMPDEAVSIAPAVVAEVALPTGTHASEAPGGMHELLGASSPAQRRRFVLQLQRTAGNAAVCRWIEGARARYAQRHGDEPDDNVSAILDAMGGDEQPPDEGGPKLR
jgi:hypothetical protein